MNSFPDTNSSTISCVVLNWNGGSDTVACIRSLLSSRDVALDIVVIDNGSMDRSVELLEEQFLTLTILKHQSNIGVAGGFNLGIDCAIAKGHSLVFFLNNDATVESDCLLVLKQVLDTNNRAGIVSPRILDRSRPGTMWFDGGRFNFAGDPVHAGMSLSSDRKADIREEGFASGCAMLVRAVVFADAGKFDERFFAYSEDVEFCLRARAHGWKILHVPEAIVTHAPSSAVKKNRGKWFRDYYVTRNKLLLLRKRVTGLRWALFLAYFGVLYVAVPSAVFLLRGKVTRVRAVWSGLGDFIKGRFGGRYS